MSMLPEAMHALTGMKTVAVTVYAQLRLLARLFAVGGPATLRVARRHIFGWVRVLEVFGYARTALAIASVFAGWCLTRYAAIPRARAMLSGKPCSPEKATLPTVNVALNTPHAVMDSYVLESQAQPQVAQLQIEDDNTSLDGSEAGGLSAQGGEPHDNTVMAIDSPVHSVAASPATSVSQTPPVPPMGINHSISPSGSSSAGESAVGTPAASSACVQTNAEETAAVARSPVGISAVSIAAEPPPQTASIFSVITAGVCSFMTAPSEEQSTTTAAETEVTKSPIAPVSPADEARSFMARTSSRSFNDTVMSAISGWSFMTAKAPEPSSDQKRRMAEHPSIMLAARLAADAAMKELEDEVAESERDAAVDSFLERITREVGDEVDMTNNSVVSMEVSVFQHESRAHRNFDEGSTTLGSIDPNDSIFKDDAEPLQQHKRPPHENKALWPTVSAVLPPTPAHDSAALNSSDISLTAAMERMGMVGESTAQQPPPSSPFAGGGDVTAGTAGEKENALSQSILSSLSNSFTESMPSPSAIGTRLQALVNSPHVTLSPRRGEGFSKKKQWSPYSMAKGQVGQKKAPLSTRTNMIQQEA